MILGDSGPDRGAIGESVVVGIVDNMIKLVENMEVPPQIV